MGYGLKIAKRFARSMRLRRTGRRSYRSRRLGKRSRRRIARRSDKTFRRRMNRI